MRTIKVLILLRIILLNGSYYNHQRIFQAIEDTTKVIENIKEQYKTVSANQKKYLLLEKDLMDESTEGGFVAAFKDVQSFRKLIATFYGDTGKITTEYYFNNKELFFAYSREYHYNKSIDQPGSKVASIAENRYYFSNKKMIRWLNGKTTKSPNSADYKDEATNLLSESKRLYKFMANCSNSSAKPLIHDTVRCKNGTDCPSTGYILKNSRNACGEATLKTRKYP